MKHSNDDLIQMLREKLAGRGARGIIGLQRVFKIVDDNNSKTLEIQEFFKALDQYRLRISQDECRRLFDLFDEDDSGEISVDEFFQTIKGPMSPFRKELVKKAFNKVDVNGNGLIEADDIRQAYNAKSHPDVLKGKRTEQEVL